MLFKLAIKNITSKKSSIVIILFIAFAVSLLVLTNAIFDSTENGVKESFVSSFTGDVVIRSKTETPLSLLGDETPVTGTFTEIPLLNPYDKIYEILKENEEITALNPQVSGMVALDFNGRHPCVIFGVETADYLQMMDSIRIVDGRPFEEGEKGMMLSTQIASKIGAGLGSDIQFIVQDGLTFKIRTAPITAIYSYSVENSVFDKIVLISPSVARELLGFDSMYEASSVQLDRHTEALLNDYDLDSLFEEDNDFYAENSETAEENLTAKQETDSEAASNVSENGELKEISWNFIVCKVNDSKKASKVIKSLNRTFKKNSWSVEAVNWRGGAGSTAMYLNFLRLLLNAGIIVVIIAGFIVINNTLVINILDRVQEIGTMRAIGTTKLFVSFECMAETLSLCMIAGLLGLLLGVAFSNILNSVKITFVNPFLIQLFGGSKLVAVINASSLFKCFLVSFILGIASWIYPVRAALKTSPVVAMTGAK